MLETKVALVALVVLLVFLALSRPPLVSTRRRHPR